MLLCATTLAWAEGRTAKPADARRPGRRPHRATPTSASPAASPRPWWTPTPSRGYEALQGGRYGEARGAYEQALKRDGTLRDALIGLAWSLEGLEDHQGAQAALRRLLELYPRDAEALAAQYLVSGGLPGDAAASLYSWPNAANATRPCISRWG